MSGAGVQLNVPAPDSFPTALFVAQDFTHWECDAPDVFARDVTIHGLPFRAIDPEYYAWLRHRMTRVKEGHVAGRVGVETYEQLRMAFNDIHAWVVGRFAERDLLRAIDRLRPKYYNPPRPFDDGRRAERDVAARVYPTGPFTRAVSAEAVSQVDAIRDAAIAVGWTERELYNTTGTLVFPYGGDYGLVCFLGDGTRVGQVAAVSIEIYRGTRSQPLRFYRRK